MTNGEGIYDYGFLRSVETRNRQDWTELFKLCKGYRKTSNKWRVWNKCRPLINAAGSDVRVLMNAGSQTNIGLQSDSQNTYKANTHTHKTMLKSILHTTKCANLTPLSTLVNDDKTINNNILYTWYIACNRCWRLEANVLINAGH